MSTETELQDTNETLKPELNKKRRLPYLLDIAVVIVMGILLYCGASWQIFFPYTDAAKYQCYADAFLHGTESVKSLPSSQCSFIFHTYGQTYTNVKIANSLRTKYHAPEVLVNFVASQNLTGSFHALPHEYPMLTLIPFVLALVSPQGWYQVGFAILMAVLAAVMYFTLLRFKSRRAAIVGTVLLVIGCWATAAGRFDLVPSLLTLATLILATQKRWILAFVALALAFLIKFYPAPLLIPLLFAQQLDSRERWYAWRRWQPLAAFIGVCIVVMGVSLLLNVEGTIAPLSYFQTRPIQVESFGSSLIWLSTFVKHHPMTYMFTYGSLNVSHVYSSLISKGETVLMIVGLLVTYWLQWRRKIDLSTSTLLTLLIVMVTGKVFSPQYLIWVVPLVAYVGGSDLRWVATWVVIGGLTTFVYPYIYNMPASGSIMDVPYVPWFYPITTLRNFILFGFILVLLIYCARREGTPALEKAEPGEVETVSP
jgi:hypothetical protein